MYLKCLAQSRELTPVTSFWGSGQNWNLSNKPKTLRYLKTEFVKQPRPMQTAVAESRQMWREYNFELGYLGFLIIINTYKTTEEITFILMYYGSTDKWKSYLDFKLGTYLSNIIGSKVSIIGELKWIVRDLVKGKETQELQL